MLHVPRVHGLPRLWGEADERRDLHVREGACVVWWAEVVRSCGEGEEQRREEGEEG
jgi:hypothetical protein